MKAFEAIFILIAIIATVVGYFMLSEATAGVGIIATGAVAGILARLLQADIHHMELFKKSNDLQDEISAIRQILEEVHNIKTE